MHSPVSHMILTDLCDSSSYAGCISIHPMPSALKSVLKEVDLLGSNISKTGEYVTPFSTFLIILSMLASKSSIALYSYKIVLGICIMSSCVFWSMEHICDRNWPIQWMRINIARLLVTPNHWFDKIRLWRTISILSDINILVYFEVTNTHYYTRIDMSEELLLYLYQKYQLSYVLRVALV